MNVAIGIDIGGTNTVIGFITKNGNCIHEEAIKTKSFKSAEQLVTTLCDKIKLAAAHLKEKIELVGIGIGAPNGNYYNGTIEFAPNLPWNGVINLSKLFSKHFSIPIAVTNDANAAAMGEMLFGGAKGIDNFVVITLGTGVGSGFVINGDIVYGHDGFAGEVGHVVIDPEGRDCGCGRKGCLETYASVTGIVRTAHIYLGKSTRKSILRDYSSNQLSGRIITEAARNGDELALEIFDYTAQKLGFCLANMVAISSPEQIIFFGGLAKAGDLLLKPTKVNMEKNLLNIFQNKIILKTSALDQNASVIGAGALIWKEIELTSHTASYVPISLN